MAEERVFKGWPFDSLRGGHETIRHLLRSPRFNRPQREVMEEVAAQLREEIEARPRLYPEEQA